MYVLLITVMVWGSNIPTIFGPFLYEKNCQEAAQAFNAEAQRQHTHWDITCVRYSGSF